MTGKQEYEAKQLKRINDVLSRNDKYLTSYYGFIGMNKTLGTRYNYILHVSNFVKETGKDLSELDMNDFTMYVSNIYATKSSSYAITTYAALKIFARYLFVSKILPEDPMYYVQRPKYVETKELVEKREQGYLTKKEIKEVQYRVTRGIGNPYAVGRQEPFKNRDMLIIMLLLSTGLRCSALVRLDVKDIDTNKKEFVMYDKGNKVNRYKIPDEVMEYYNAWIIDRNIMLERSQVETSALFISKFKTRMSTQAISDVVQKFTAKTGKHITPHKLRATYGTQLYDATHDIYFVQQCMHHSDPKITELYIRGRKADTDRAAEIMGKLL